jgi:hypothetical protein
MAGAGSKRAKLEAKWPTIRHGERKEVTDPKEVVLGTFHRGGETTILLDDGISAYID